MPGSSYLTQLNEVQRSAVEYLGGTELVIAGAGSGKTRVLTYKIVHLLEKGHSPRRILALTFTNKAAREMRERIEKLVGQDVASQLWMGTFHSIFSRMLRRNADLIGFKSDFTVYDASDSKSLIRSIIKDMNLDDKVYRPGLVMADISNAKNNLCSPEAYAADPEIMAADRAARRERTAEIYAAYHERCRIAGAMDFDDLLYYTNVLMRDNPELCKRYRDYFSYILVDEYQDTNFAQHHIVLRLCEGKNNLCVVGDDAQSIYSFRGANIRNILTMQKAFPDLHVFKLEENYRSTQNIIGAANTLIAANTEQIPKEVFSRNDLGERVEVVQCYNDYEESYVVAGRIGQVRMRMRLPLNEVAILYRTNAQSRVLEEALRNRNIPYRIFGGQSFYTRAEIKDAISYFRLAVNPDDDEAFRRVLNTPKRGIGETTEKKLLGAAIASQVSMFTVAMNPKQYGLSVNSGTAKKLLDFASLINGFVESNRRGDNAAFLAREILKESGLAKQYMTDNTPENISRQENINELVKGVDTFVDTHRQTDGENAVGMTNYLSEISLLTDQDTNAADGDCVTLMTIHSAKGLEFDAVFIVGVEDDIIPSARCHRDISQIEEERRLLYVAITRARRFCMITYSMKRTVNGQPMNSTPSRFLRDISPRFLNMKNGSRLDGPSYREDNYGRNSFSRDESEVFGRISEPRTPRTPSAPSGRSAIPQVHRDLAASDSRPAPKAAVDGYSCHTAEEIREGTRIEHKTFGHGVVRELNTSSNGDKITVHFSASGENKTLLLKFALFKILS